jgi:adenylyltransferase/sulfurtransferase
MPSEITPSEFKQRWDAGEKLVLIDVRERAEWQICNLAPFGAKLIPLAQVGDRLAEIPQDREVVLHCHLGGRSGRAQQYLEAKGYTKVLNMTGGITRWADEVDPSLPQY